jgi:hypothetical protein
MYGFLYADFHESPAHSLGTNLNTFSGPNFKQNRQKNVEIVGKIPVALKQVQLSLR